MMEYLHELSWDDVFQMWKQHEGFDAGWLRVATKDKGWPDWESWRMFTAQQLLLSGRKWSLYQMTDPMMDISNMQIGPYSGWQSRCTEPNTSTFFDLAQIPDQKTFFASHDKVRSMREMFPKDTMFIGLMMKQNSRIVCIEGHHRAMAVALARLEGRSIDDCGSVTIALATMEDEEIQLLNDVLARGTHK